MADAEKHKVLVVDDEPDAVEFVRAVMEEAGCQVVDASNGPAGIRKAEEEQPDLVILDVQMPEMDGFTVFAEMRKNPSLKDVPVVMLTGVSGKLGISFSAEDMGDYIGEEPNAYLEKPIDPEALQQTASDLLGT